MHSSRGVHEAAGLDALLKAVSVEEAGEAGPAWADLSEAPSLLPGEAIWPAVPVLCPGGPTQPASGSEPQRAQSPQASHLQITLSVGLDQLRCCITKSLPPMMEPE